jgi:D-cysteine desulfhydrase
VTDSPIAGDTALATAAQLPRLLLATLPTPLVEASRLTHALGGPPIYVKRDDLAGFGLAGHKARQLEFLVGAALDQGCDVMVTGGGPSSNFCAAAAAAASAAGLDCHLVLAGAEPEQTHPNLAVAQACGAVVRYTRDPNRSSVDARVVEVADALKAGGRKPFAMPRGGATGLGTVGMVLGVQELAAQLDELGIEPDMVVIATGSGGAGAGLALGASLCGRTWRVVGASVSRPANEIATQVRMLAADCAELLGVAPPADRGLELADARGPGHGHPSADGESAARVALRTEGLVLDPVYTAKALAVLLRLLDPASKRPVVFWHTGGLLGAAHHLAGGHEE